MIIFIYANLNGSISRVVWSKSMVTANVKCTTPRTRQSEAEKLRLKLITITLFRFYDIRRLLEQYLAGLQTDVNRMLECVWRRHWVCICGKSRYATGVCNESGDEADWPSCDMVRSASEVWTVVRLWHVADTGLCRTSLKYKSQRSPSSYGL